MAKKKVAVKRCICPPTKDIETKVKQGVIAYNLESGKWSHQYVAFMTETLEERPCPCGTLHLGYRVSYDEAIYEEDLIKLGGASAGAVLKAWVALTRHLESLIHGARGKRK